MTAEKLKSLCDLYHAEMARAGAVAKKMDEHVLIEDDDIHEVRDHIAWACEYAKKLADQDMAVAQQWLGFIQGVLWGLGDYSIEEMREHDVLDVTPHYGPAGVGNLGRTDLPGFTKDD